MTPRHDDEALTPEQVREIAAAQARNHNAARLLKYAVGVIAFLVGAVMSLVGVIARGNAETVTTQAAEIRVLQQVDQGAIVKITTLEQQQKEDERFREEMRLKLDTMSRQLAELVERSRRGER